MNLTTNTLLINTIHGQASGNYDGSSLDFDSDPVQAADYYQGQGSIQTFTITVTGFVGRIHIEGTLQDDPAQAAWFELFEYGDLIAPRTETHTQTVTGNFVWLRANVVDFDAGTINSLTVTY